MGKEREKRANTIIKNNKASVFFRMLFLAVTGCILLLVLFVDKAIDYSALCTLEVKAPNILLAILGVVLVAGMLWLWRRMSKSESLQHFLERHFYALLWAGFGIGLLIQMVIAYHIYFHAGWDVSIVMGTANGLATQTAEIGDFYYYSQYTNNVGIVAFLAFIQKLAFGLGLLPTQGYLVCVMAGCFMISLAGLLTVLAVRKLTDNCKAAFLAGILFFGLIGLNPWMAVPYTDSYSILFPILTLYLYLCAKQEQKKWTVAGFWVLAGMAGGIGYLIKPSAVIVLIAVVLYEVLQLLFGGKTNWKRIIMSLVMMLAGMLIAAGLKVGMERFTKCDYKEELAFSLTHYLMMGLNEETTGSYSSEDYGFSGSFATVEERTAGNMAVVSERLREYGVVGYLQFLVKKALVNFNDGTFSWGMEGGFIASDSYHKHTALQTALRQFYYTTGETYWLYTLFAQGIWLIVQMALPCMALLRKGREKDGETVVMISLLGIVAFVMLFESRARYLYNMAPIFVVAAAIGIMAVYQQVKRKVLK